MNTTHYQPLKTALLASLLAGAFVSLCSADIIYKDTFARAGAGPLNGSAPTVDNTGGAATWTASAGFTCDGTVGVVNNNNGGDWPGSAVLPLNWNTTYPDPKAQIDVQFVQPGDWVVLQFGDCSYWGSPGMPAVLKLYGNGNVEVCQGPGWDGGFIKASFSGAGTALDWNRLRIEYSNTLAVASFYVNGALLTTLPVPNTTSWNTGVGFNSNCGMNAYLTNLLVTFGSEVINPPAITSEPVGQAVFTNDPIRLSVEVSGTLPLSFQWRKNGVDIPDATSRLYSVSAAAMSNTADYTVVITNSAPTANVVTSTVARVEVHFEAKSPIAQVNFDDLSTMAYTFGFAYSSDPTLILPRGWTNEPGVGIGGSNGFKIYADGSEFLEASVTYAGLGGGCALNTSLLVSSLYFYEATFSARVENLMGAVTSTPGRAALRFFAPDGTTGPTNGAQDLIFSVEQPCTYSSNYQAFTFVLNNANYGGDAGLAQFLRYRTNINIVQFEFTLDNFYANFVNGPGDAVVVDNLKLALRQSPPLSVTWNGTQSVLQWDDPNVQLQGAADPIGPYTDISGATSPYMVPVDSPFHYFRTRFAVVP